MQPNTVESGTRLAGRYRLEERLKAADDFTTWRAVDEKLSRDVAVHVLPADDPKAKTVVQAAQAAAMLSDRRFCQVLDASQQDDVIYVVEELLRGVSVATLLANGPLPSGEAAQLTADVAAALAAAHAAGLAHLCLHPENIHRTETGQIKVSGLSVEAALSGATFPDPAAADARRLGALLYACLTARWPDGAAHGLAAAPTEGGTLCSPRQVRAGVPAALDEIATRALSDVPPHGRTPLRTPAEVGAALAAAPRPKRSAAEEATQVGFATPGVPAAAGAYPAASRGYPTAGYPAAAGGYPAAAGGYQLAPADRGRSGRLVAALVALIVVAGAVLFAITLIARSPKGGNQASAGGNSTPTARPGAPVQIANVTDFDPEDQGDNGQENHNQVRNAFDHDPSTAWHTRDYYNKPRFGNLKKGLGLIVDLGKVVQVGSVTVRFEQPGAGVELRSAAASVADQPSSLKSFGLLAKVGSADGVQKFSLSQPTNTRYLLVWLTSLPEAGHATFKAGIADISVTS